MISNRKTGDRVEQAVFLLLIALSLALDAFAVSVSSGVAVPGFGPAQALKLGVWFGAFQFAMPLAGWLLGAGVSAYVEAADHWIAFVLLALIGGRMAAVQRFEHFPDGQQSVVQGDGQFVENDYVVRSGTEQ